MIVPAHERERETAIEQEALREKFAETEHEAKRVEDWRAYVRKSPLTMMGVAFGSGVLIAAMAAPRSTRTRRGHAHASNGDGEPSAARDAWEIFLGALISSAAAYVTANAADVLPDFKEHLEAQRRERAARRRRARAGSGTNGESETGSTI